jgi:hypothetical protein
MRLNLILIAAIISLSFIFVLSLAGAQMTPLDVMNMGGPSPIQVVNLQGTNPAVFDTTAFSKDTVWVTSPRFIMTDPYLDYVNWYTGRLTWMASKQPVTASVKEI